MNPTKQAAIKDIGNVLSRDLMALLRIVDTSNDYVHLLTQAHDLLKDITPTKFRLRKATQEYIYGVIESLKQNKVNNMKGIILEHLVTPESYKEGFSTLFEDITERMHKYAKNKVFVTFDLGRFPPFRQNETIASILSTYIELNNVFSKDLYGDKTVLFNELYSQCRNWLKPYLDEEVENSLFVYATLYSNSIFYQREIRCVKKTSVFIM